MLPTTRESTLAEHLKLVEMINRLTSALLDLARDIKGGDTEYYEDAIFLNRLRFQATSLGDLVHDILNGRYREAYNNIRMIFEFYLLFELLSTGTKYTMRYQIRRSNGDATLNEPAVGTLSVSIAKRKIRSLYCKRALRSWIPTEFQLEIWFPGSSQRGKIIDPIIISI